MSDNENYDDLTIAEILSGKSEKELNILKCRWLAIKEYEAERTNHDFHLLHTIPVESECCQHPFMVAMLYHWISLQEDEAECKEKEPPKTETHDFSWALEKLKAGYAVRRLCWVGDTFLFLHYETNELRIINCHDLSQCPFDLNMQNGLDASDWCEV